MPTTLKTDKRDAADHNESWVEHPVTTYVQKNKWYDSSYVAKRSRRANVAAVPANVDSPDVASLLSAILRSDSADEAYRAGRMAHAWLDSLQEPNRLGFLRGFARVVIEASRQVLQNPTVYVVCMELLSRFAPPLAAPIVMDSLPQRPLVREHVYLVALAQFLNSPITESQDLPSAIAAVSELLKEALLLDPQVDWRPDLIVECVRMLSKVAPAELVNRLCPKLSAIGEIEMTTVLGELVTAAGKISSCDQLATQLPYIDSIWDVYSQDPELMNAEGILARLAQFYMIAGQPTQAVIDRVGQLPIGTDVLYLAAIENLPIQEKSDKELFFRVAAARLLEESQGLALSSLLACAQKQGINVSTMFES